MKNEIHTILIYEPGYFFTFRQYDSYNKAFEASQEYQNMGLGASLSPTLSAEEAERWIRNRTVEYEDAGLKFDGSGGFIG